jgi:multiple antibiotic resistance protein
MIAYFIHAVVSIFAVLNPLGILPTYLALTTGYSVKEQRQIAKKSVLNAFLILFVFLMLGSWILSLFSITIHAFRVAGGILLFNIAYDLLHAKASKVQTPQNEESGPKDDISMTPLAIPIIAGPGTITTVMALAAGGQNVVQQTIVVGIAFTVVLILTYIFFYYASAIHHRMSEVQLNVITRLMGFLLSIIAIQMVANGIIGLFPGLLRA